MDTSSSQQSARRPRMRLTSRLFLSNHKPLRVKRYVLCSVVARQP
jgi:hypothetical protein